MSPLFKGHRVRITLPVKGAQDAAFDAVTSIYGAMFAPRQEQVAAEIIRVSRPGGTVALASWTPEGFLGAMFKTIGSHVPPPPGVQSPMLWGTEARLEEIFGADVEWTAHNRRIFNFRYRSAEEFVDFFITYYGPTLKAFEAAGDDGPALRTDLVELAREWNRLDDDAGAIAIPGEYLESVGRRV
jgi:SAM-dependent methyltransferase